MNDVDLVLVESKRIERLKTYGLDDESIKKFRSKIKIVSDEEKERLGKELFEMLMSKGYDEEKDLDKVIQLIFDGADVEYKDEKKGDFSLLRCARKNYTKTFIALLKAGADINQKNKFLTTATMASARHDCRIILWLLIMLKADINAKSIDGDTALISARKHKNYDCFKMLIEANANLNVICQDGRSIYTYKSDSQFNYHELGITDEDKSMQLVTSEDTVDLLKEATEKMLKITKILN